MSNADVARLTYLSPNTVKSYIRTIYRKLGVGSRTQAVLWGVDHGFTPTITASNTGAADPEFLHRQAREPSGMPLREHRHPRYQGLRTDKDPGDVVRETH